MFRLFRPFPSPASKRREALGKEFVPLIFIQKLLKSTGIIVIIVVFLTQPWGLQKLKMGENPYLIRCILLTLYLGNFFANVERKKLNILFKASQL